MYPEFIAIYIGLGVLAILLTVVIVLLVLVLKKVSKGSNDRRSYNANASNAEYSAGNGLGVVFCPNCGTQYDGATRICPRCGFSR